MTRQPSFALAATALGLAAAAGLGVGGLWSHDVAQASQATPAAGATTSAPTPSRAAPEITLSGDKSRAVSGERINLAGRAAGSGISLVVQERNDGAWVDFPAHGTTRSDGSFASYVLFGRTGAHVLRMVAPSTGAVSNPVTVTIN